MSKSAKNIATAIAVAGLVVAAEYFVRHYVLFWMPIVGTRRVNDLLVLALVYSLLTVTLGALAHIVWRDELVQIRHASRDLVTRWEATRWFLAIMVSLVALPFADRVLWAKLSMPMHVSSYRNSAIWLVGAAPILNGLASVGVNGVLVPTAEEYLWRGVIQARLQQAIPSAWAIGTTAVMFSLKHVVVDASWDRFLTLVAFGAICGLVAHRSTWRHSAALHMFVNTVTTIVGLVTDTARS